jgi:hypothetical protein
VSLLGIVVILKIVISVLKFWNKNFAFAIPRVKMGGLRYKGLPCV